MEFYSTDALESFTPVDQQLTRLVYICTGICNGTLTVTAKHQEVKSSWIDQLIRHLKWADFIFVRGLNPVMLSEFY